MPRKSKAELSMWFPYAEPPPTILRPRADAPAKVREIFATLVKSVPPAHFRRGDADLVEQLAQAIVLARQAYAELEAGGPVVDGKVSPWNIVLEKAHRSSVALAGKLRLCPQARTDPKVAGGRAAGWKGYSAYQLEDIGDGQQPE